MKDPRPRRRKVETNKVRCLQCDDEITSRHRHDFVWCKCGAVAIDGGTDYLKRTGEFHNIKDLSTFVKHKCGTEIEFMSIYTDPDHPLMVERKEKLGDKIYMFSGFWYCPNCDKRVVYAAANGNNDE